MSLFKSASKVERMWRWFAANSSKMHSDEVNNSLCEDFYGKLHAIHPSLVFEIGAEDRSGVRVLTISCDGIIEGISSVEKVTVSAPEIAGWRIVAFRQPVDEILALEAEGLKLATDDIKFDYEDAPGDKVDLMLYVDGVDDNNKNDYLSASYVLLDAAIGEYFAMTRIRHLDLLPMSDGVASLQPLSRLLSILK